MATTQTYGGDIIDWVDPASVPGSDLAPPDSSPPESESPAASEQQQMPLTEFDVYPELKGPLGTLPFTRPNYGRYVAGKTNAENIAQFLKGQVMGRTDGANRLYTGYGVVDTVTYSSVRLPVWRSSTVEDNTFTLAETGIRCPTTGDDGEIVGATLSRDRVNFADDPADGNTPQIVGPSRPHLRLQVETYSQGNPDPNDDFNEWARAPTYGRFTPAQDAPFLPGVAFDPSAVSTVGGTQYEWRVEWALDDGNWWLKVGGSWIGYYSTAELDYFPDGKGCQVAWYGEVFDPSPSTWTANDMISPEFGGTGWQSAARYLYPMYCRGDNWSDCKYMHSSAFLLGLQDSACYTTSSLSDEFFVGGPGRRTSGGTVLCP